MSNASAPTVQYCRGTTFTASRDAAGHSTLVRHTFVKPDNVRFVSLDWAAERLTLMVADSSLPAFALWLSFNAAQFLPKLSYPLKRELLGLQCVGRHVGGSNGGQQYPTILLDTPVVTVLSRHSIDVRITDARFTDFEFTVTLDEHVVAAAPRQLAFGAESPDQPDPSDSDSDSDSAFC